jgi:hypothetical protein
MLSISLDYGQTVSAVRSLEKTASNIPTRIIDQITINGKLLSLGGVDSGSGKIQAEVDRIKADNSGYKSTVSCGGNSYSNVKIISISFNQSNSRDVFEKDFSIVFEKISQAPVSILENYGLSPQDLLNIKDIQTSSGLESNQEGKFLNQSCTIIFEPYANKDENEGARIAKSFFEASSQALGLGSTQDNRIALGSIINKAGNTYSFTESRIEFATPKGGSNGPGVFKKTNATIQNNGAIIGTINVSKKFTNIIDDSYRAQDLYDSINGLINQEVQSLKQNILPLINYATTKQGNHYDKFSLTDKQISINESSGTAEGTAVISNLPEISDQDKMKKEIFYLIENIEAEDAKRLTVRGSLQALYIPPDKEFSESNKKAKAVFDKFKSTFGNFFDTSSQRTDQKGSLSSLGIQELNLKYKTYATNASVNINVTDGIIDFSITFESKQSFEVKDENILLAEGSAVGASPIHLANFFIVLGGLSKGEELIQQSGQSKLKPYIINLNGLGKKTAGREILSFIKTIYNGNKKSVTEKINYSANLIKKTFQASITQYDDGQYRERSDVALKATSEPLEI